MARASRQPDPRQGDLLSGYELAETSDKPAAGSLDIASELCAALAQAIKEAPDSRAIIAARMSDLTGKTISEDMLNKWTSKASDGWRFPFEYAPAFEVATGSQILVTLLARKCRVLVMTPKDGRDAEIGRMQRQKREIDVRLRKLLGDE